jgi:hypothetical protein
MEKFEYDIMIQEFDRLPVEKTRKLAIYDFDSTLFNSPLPNPKLWTKSFMGKILSDCQWFCDIRTLSDPYIPNVPGDEWWNDEILNKAKASLAESDTLTILLTGRRKVPFLDRIRNLCLQQCLDFHLFDILIKVYTKRTCQLWNAKSFFYVRI